ncbi:hypothetical protein [Bacteroides sp.]|uniref:hypothetical protein n=1 Tax=Bacteroides sp. TaxID=29523 RepID=UPI0025C18960|nr:hypothetical protein [Bacteroides sp.]
MSNTSSTFLPTDGDNRLLDVPFGNDSFRGYSANPWNTSSVSLIGNELKCEIPADDIRVYCFEKKKR